MWDVFVLSLMARDMNEKAKSLDVPLPQPPSPDKSLHTKDVVLQKHHTLHKNEQMVDNAPELKYNKLRRSEVTKIDKHLANLIFWTFMEWN